MTFHKHGFSLGLNAPNLRIPQRDKQIRLECPEKSERDVVDWDITQMFHVWYIFLHLHTNEPNVGKYTIHGSCGLQYVFVDVESKLAGGWKGAP